MPNILPDNELYSCLDKYENTLAIFKSIREYFKLKNMHSSDNWNAEFQKAFNEQNQTKQNYTILADQSNSNDMFADDSEIDLFVPGTQQLIRNDVTESFRVDESQDLLTQDLRALIRNDEPIRSTEICSESQDLLGNSFYCSPPVASTSIKQVIKFESPISLNDTNGNVELFDSDDEDIEKEMSALVWDSTRNDDNVEATNQNVDENSLTPDLLDIPISNDTTRKNDIEIDDEHSVTPDLPDIPAVSSTKSSSSPKIVITSIDGAIDGNVTTTNYHEIATIDDIEDDCSPTQLFKVTAPLGSQDITINTSMDAEINDDENLPATQQFNISTAIHRKTNENVTINTSMDAEINDDENLPATQQFDISTAIHQKTNENVVVSATSLVDVNKITENENDSYLEATQLFIPLDVDVDDKNLPKKSDTNTFAVPLPPPARKQKKKIVSTLAPANIDNSLDETQVFSLSSTNKSPDNAYHQLTQVMPTNNDADDDDFYSASTQKFEPSSSYTALTQQLPSTSSYTALTQQLPSTSSYTELTQQMPSSSISVETPAKKLSVSDEPCTPQFDFLDYTKDSQVVRNAICKLQTRQNNTIKSTNPIFIDSSDDDDENDNCAQILPIIKREKSSFESKNKIEGITNKKSVNQPSSDDDDEELIKPIKNKSLINQEKNKKKDNAKKFRPKLYSDSDDSESSTEDSIDVEQQQKILPVNTPKNSTKKIVKNNLFGDDSDDDSLAENNKTARSKKGSNDEVKLMKSCQVKLTPTLRNRQMKAEEKKIQRENGKTNKTVENKVKDLPAIKSTVLTPPLQLRTRSKCQKKEEILIMKETKVEPTSKRTQNFDVGKSNKRVKSADIKNESMSNSNDETISKRTRRVTPLKLMFTKVDSTQYIAKIDKLGAQIVDKPNLCTILITDKVYRTCKFLCALSRGIPIVSEKWIIDIENKNQLTATNDYLINDQNSEKRYKFSLSQSLKMAKNKPLYCNYSIIVTPSTKPTPQELNDIITCAGGKCCLTLSQPPRQNDKIFAISASEDKAMWPKIKEIHPRIKIVNTEAFMLTILQQNHNNIEDRRYILN